jgi:hypothetical protein
MTNKSNYLFIASMDVSRDQEDLFNTVYDTEHIPNLLNVPGVISVVRYKKIPLTMYLGGEKKEMIFDAEPTYHAYYEVTSPDVLTSPEWHEAVELGRWPKQVRPHTLNRRHILTQKQ